MTQKTVPAVLLGEGLTVMGTLRSLNAVGVPGLCISSQPGLETHSRLYHSPGSASTAASIYTVLEKAGIEKGVLIPCSDHWLGEISSATPHDRFPAICAPPELVEQFVDKGKFAALLKRTDVPRPQTFLITSARECLDLDPGCFQGYFLKPRRSQQFCNLFYRKGIPIHERQECLQQFERITKAGFQVILQEIIPGPASSHYYVEGYVSRAGRVCALFARQRLRMYPAEFGNSTLMQSIPLHDIPEAVASIEKIIQKSGLTGIFSAEFKRDERDGLMKIIEVNVRPWWYVEFMTHCGINVLEMAYGDALGETPAPARRYRVGVRSMNLTNDIRVARDLWWEGQLTARDYLQSVLSARTCLWSWRDPWPAVVVFFKNLKEMLLQSLPARVKTFWKARAAGVSLGNLQSGRPGV